MERKQIKVGVSQRQGPPPGYSWSVWVLGMNVRVFYGVDHEARSIVVLGCIKKQNDGPTPRGDVIRMRRRWRKYRAGNYGRPSAG